MSRWLKAARRRRWRERSMPLPNTSPLLSPMPPTVTGPVAGAGYGHGRAIEVAAGLARVLAGALPRAARGDAEPLVVVTAPPARGEGVAEPEVARGRELVGEVGKGGGPFVGGDDQV